MTDTIHAWDKLDTDTDKSYQAFCVYRDLGKGRSLEKVQERLSKSTGYLRQLYKWSSNYNWVERANAYDLHLDRTQRNAVEKMRIEASTRLIEGMLDRCQQMFERWDESYRHAKLLTQKRVIERDGHTIEIHELNIDDQHKFSKWLADIDSLMRRQLELPDKYTQQKVDMTPSRDETWMQALRDLENESDDW